MNYLQFDFEFDPEKLDPEILTAYLAEAGFESFVLEQDRFSAFIRKGDFSQSMLSHLLEVELAAYLIRMKKKEIRDRNWNEVWESNFSPVAIAGQIYVRAPFHAPDPSFPIEIVIEPKMSFGTAHHETTALMMELMLDLDVSGKDLLDMGCGTGVLAILAEKLGAASVTAIDNDEWAYRNATENMETNGCIRVTTLLGDAGLLGGRKFDVILANINRNILLRDIPAYHQALNREGMLLLSGFYEADLEMLKEAAGKLKYTLRRYLMKNEWVAALFC